MDADPDSLFSKLLSKDLRQTGDALNRLGLSWLADRVPTDVRLFAVNLDSDEDLERVLIVHAGLDTAALALKREDGTWWQLGAFACCMGTEILDPFVELKETVWYGTNDLVVHETSAHGTGVGENRLSIYRAWKGRLYRVLRIVESAYNLPGSEESRISYPNIDTPTAPRILVVHRTSETGRRRATVCIPYRWDAARFEFVQLAPNRALCGE